jgi:hypothetical protein
LIYDGIKVPLIVGPNEGKSLREMVGPNGPIIKLRLMVGPNVRYLLREQVGPNGKISMLWLVSWAHAMI